MVSRFSVISAVLWLTASVTGCGPTHQRGNDEVVPALTFDKLEFRVYRGPVLTAVGNADRASFRRDTSGLHAERIDVRFPEEANRAEAQVVAAEGEGNLRERWFTGQGGVVATQEAQVARTERARYSAADGLIRGDRPIQVDGGRFHVRGPEFLLDPQAEILDVTGGAHLTAGGAR
jgi:hypothetical protein